MAVLRWPVVRRLRPVVALRTGCVGARGFALPLQLFMRIDRLTVVRTPKSTYVDLRKKCLQRPPVGRWVTKAINAMPNKPSAVRLADLSARDRPRLLCTE